MNQVGWSNDEKKKLPQESNSNPTFFLCLAILANIDAGCLGKLHWSASPSI
jgi:hypothetical protein